ncbi:MAG: hypothetical protein AB1646_12185 [Thermodesulfobacteriota bacterium]
MNQADVQLLQCIQCHGDLRIVAGDLDNGLLDNGLLGCADCGAEYPVIDGVGVFFRQSVLSHYLSEYELGRLSEMGAAHLAGNREQTLDPSERRQLAVSENWEYQWSEVIPFSVADLTSDAENMFGENVFWRFIPLSPADIEGKTVFVACAGRGREVFHISRRNPARIICNEIGTEIYAIRGLLPQWRDRLLLVRSDLCHNPLKPGVADVSICDHALQHVPDHKLGFANLVRATGDRGLVCICVYSYENNFAMTHVVEPLKSVMHRLPLRGQRMLAYLPGLMVWLVINLVYMPVRRVSERLFTRLPLHQHMLFWSHNSLGTLCWQCFDLIHAPVSYHFRKEEILSLVREHRLSPRLLENTHGALWSLVALRE